MPYMPNPRKVREDEQAARMLEIDPPETRQSERLAAELRSYDEKPGLLREILSTFGPIAGGAAFGGLEGAAGAAQGVNEGKDISYERRERRRSQLREDMRRAQDQEYRTDRDRITDTRYEDEKIYSRGRDAVADERYREGVTRQDKQFKTQHSKDTKEVDGRIRQFNPETNKYDIDLGPVTNKPRENTLIEDMHDREHPDHKMTLTEYEEYQNRLAKMQRRASGGGPAPVFSPVTDDRGNVIGKWNNRTGEAIGMDNKPLTNFRKNAQPETRNAREDAIKYIEGRLESLDQLLPKLTSKGWMDKIDIRGIGPMDAIAGKFKEGIVGDKDLATLYQLILELSDTELRKRSGAAITDIEYDRMRRFLLDPGTADESFLSRLQGWREMLREMRQASGMGPREPLPGTGGLPSGWR